MQHFIFILDSRAHNLSHRVHMKVRKFSHVCISDKWNDAITQMIKINTKQVNKTNATEYFS